MPLASLQSFNLSFPKFFYHGRKKSSVKYFARSLASCCCLVLRGIERRNVTSRYYGNKISVSQSQMKLNKIDEYLLSSHRNFATIAT